MARFKGLAVARMKAEILKDVLGGPIPPTVASFEDLYYYRNANKYGGFCDEEYIHSPLFKFETECQTEVDNWIKSGGLREAYEIRIANVVEP